jgi:hypothetical protein
MKNWFVKFIREEMRILHAKLLIKHFWRIDKDLCFMSNLIQTIINILMLSYRRNIHMELRYTSLHEFF